MAHDDDSEAPPRSVVSPNVSLPARTPLPETTQGTDQELQVFQMFGPGTRIAERYTVKAVLGTGGMGTVYRAVDEALGEDVALKVLKGGLAENEYLRDEVRLAQKVTHPNVCRTFDLEHEGKLRFIKMEYVAGELLAERIKRDRLTIAEVVRIARGIAAGLGAIHAQKIIHRDLKPGNVMLARDGRVVLMDFGLATQARSKDTGIAGTPGYMAPEQLLGGDLDERTDYYALGCVIYELLVGETVYGKGSMPEISDRHVEAEVPEVRGKRRDTPRWLARATEALLAKQPEGRPEGLARLAAKPHRTWIPMVLALAIGVVAVMIVWVVRGGLTSWRPEVVDLPQSEESSDGASLSPDGRLIAWNSNRSEEKFRLYVANVDGTNERRLPQDGSFDEPRWSRDGNYLLSSAGDNNDLQRVPIDGGAPIMLGASGRNPDECGKGIVFVRADNAGYRLFYKPYSGPELELLRAYADEWLEKPRCDPSGTFVVFLRGMAPASAFGTDVYMIDVAGNGRVTPIATDHNAGAATFSSTGDTIIYSTRLPDGKIQLVEAPIGGGPGRQVTFDDGPDSSPDMSRDGTTLLFAREVNLFSIYGGEGETDKPRKLSSRRESAYNLRVASPKGELVLAERAPGTVLVIDTTTGNDRVLTPGRLPFASLDGQTVFFRDVDDAAQLMSIPLAPGGTAKKVAKLPGRIVLGVDGPDGQHVMVDEDEHHLVSNRVGPDGTLTDEGAHWVVPAPKGGWRFWQRPGATVELRLIAPGKPLGSMDCVFEVESTINQWLDEHHLAFMKTIEVKVKAKTESHEVWHILDVRTCAAEQPSISLVDVGSYGLNSVIAADGKSWFTTKSVSRVTRHVARNFASRPR